MPTLKFTIKGVPFEYVGNQHEIIDFINGFLGGSIVLPAQAKPTTPSLQSVTLKTEADVEEMIDVPAPLDEEVERYITSKPDFSHNLFEVQRIFFGKTFTSRGNTKRMYHRTARQLRLIRKQIEKEYKGKFIEETGEHGLKQFTFKKSVPEIAVAKN